MVHRVDAALFSQGRLHCLARAPFLLPSIDNMHVSELGTWGLLLEGLEASSSLH